MSQRTQLALVAAGCFLLGCLLAPQLPFAFGQEKPKAPKWMHALNLGARKSNEPDFTSTTKQYGIEVFRDENNGNLIYISETGSIAVVRQ
jgi:hypothetical protein